MKKAPTLAEASPYKSVAQELEALRGMFRLACRQYTERVEMEIIRVREQVVAAGMQAAEREKALAGKSLVGAGKTAGSTRSSGGTGTARQAKAEDELAQLRDLRDMLTLLRTMQIKPQEGRRKDLKKIESVISDLELLAAQWG